MRPSVRFRWILGPAFVVIILFLTQIVWRPWLSPRYTAQQLAIDDGKGFVFWIGNAARFWGHHIYHPLLESTEGFDYLKSPMIFTLMDIIASDNAESVADFSVKLLNANSRQARLLGCFAAVKHKLTTPTPGLCEDLVQGVLSEEATIDNQVEIRVALRISGNARMTKMSQLVMGHINNISAPHGVVADACEAELNMFGRMSHRKCFPE